MKCTFCGHSSITDIIDDRLYNTLLALVHQYNITEFYCGYHGDFDRACIDAVGKIHRQYPNIVCTVVTPYHSDNVCEYFNGSRSCFQTLYPFEKFVPYRHAIQLANQYKVDNSDIVVCCVEYTFGGAYTSMQYAQRKKKLCINLADK